MERRSGMCSRSCHSVQSGSLPGVTSCEKASRARPSRLMSGTLPGARAPCQTARCYNRAPFGAQGATLTYQPAALDEGAPLPSRRSHMTQIDPVWATVAELSRAFGARALSPVDAVEALLERIRR